MTDIWPLKVALSRIPERATRVPQRFAYVSALWGDDVKNLTLGMALGQSIAASGSTLPRILLLTHDVPREYHTILQQWWTLVMVSYIPCYDLCKNERFLNVFTKLHIFNLEGFDKVLWLDLDTLLLQNIEHVFDQNAPAALPITGRGNHLEDFYDLYDHGDLMEEDTPINAGVMLVAPHEEVFNLLIADVTQVDPRWHYQSNTPEQSYLQRALTWYCMDVGLNLEPTFSAGVSLTRKWLARKEESVEVVHFSTCNLAPRCCFFVALQSRSTLRNL